MAMSKQKLVAGMKRTRLSLNDKINILNYAIENPKKGRRDIANQFQIGEVVNGKEGTIDSDLDDEDDANESSSSDATVTAKEALYLLDKVQLFAAYNDEQGSLQKAVADIISMVEDFSIHSKKQSSITDFFKKK